jgi:hypothetical protein
MEYLNIGKNYSRNFMGNTVVVRGQRYYVGEFIASGQTKDVYHLYNYNSKICSHVIKIYRDQSNKRPITNEILAFLMAEKIGINLPTIILPTEEELEKYHNDMLFHIEPLFTGNRLYNLPRIDDAKRKMKEENLHEAQVIFDELITNNEFNTEALLGAYMCERDLFGLNNKGIDYLYKILEVEPNSPYYCNFVLCSLINHNLFDEYQRLIGKIESYENAYFSIGVLHKSLEKQISDDNKISVELSEQLELVYEGMLKHYTEPKVAIPFDDLVSDATFIRDAVIVCFEGEEKNGNLIAFDYSSILDVHEWDSDVDEAVNRFNKDSNDISSYEIMSKIVYGHINQERVVLLFLKLAYHFEKYVEFVDVYRKTNIGHTNEIIQYMALESFLKIGFIEDAISLSYSLKLSSEMYEIIENMEINKTMQENLIDESMQCLIEKNDMGLAKEKLAEAYSLFPFGMDVNINHLIKCIEKNTEFQMVNTILKYSRREYIYFMLHIIIYKVTREEYDEGLIHAINEFIINLSKIQDEFKSVDDYPSRCYLYSSMGTLEEPLSSTYKILEQGYNGLKQKYDGNENDFREYEMLVKHYRMLGETQIVSNM